MMLGIFTENNNFKRIFSKLKTEKPDFHFIQFHILFHIIYTKKENLRFRFRIFSE